MYKKETFVNPRNVMNQGSLWDYKLQREWMHGPSTKEIFKISCKSFN